MADIRHLVGDSQDEKHLLRTFTDECMSSNTILKYWRLILEHKHPIPISPSMSMDATLVIKYLFVKAKNINHYCQVHTAKNSCCILSVWKLSASTKGFSAVTAKLKDIPITTPTSSMNFRKSLRSAAMMTTSTAPTNLRGRPRNAESRRRLGGAQ